MTRLVRLLSKVYGPPLWPYAILCLAASVAGLLSALYTEIIHAAAQ